MTLKTLFSLKSKLFVAFFCLAVFITLAISYVLFFHMRTNHLDTLKRDMIAIAGVAALRMERVSPLILSDGMDSPEDLKEYLREIRLQSVNIASVFIIRPDSWFGRHVFVTDNYGSPADSKAANDQVALFSDSGFSNMPTWTPGIAEKGEIITAFAPIRTTDGHLAAVLGVVVDGRKFAEDIQHFTVQVIQLTAYVVLVVAAASLILACNFTRRLSRLDEALERIASGESNIELTVDGRDEVALLAGRINRLASALCGEREDLLFSAIKSLVAALEAKDAYTYGHSAQVSDMADAVAKRLNVNEQERFRIKIAALLHDIGKIGIPDKVLNKTGMLDAGERIVIQQHSEIGARILSGIPALAQVTEVVRHHHARWNGTGYPETLAGESIPLGARIIAIADTFQAMTSDRPYRKGVENEAAIKEIRRCAGSQFDPGLVAVFGEIYKGLVNKDRVGA